MKSSDRPRRAPQKPRKGANAFPTLGAAPGQQKRPERPRMGISHRGRRPK